MWSDTPDIPGRPTVRDKGGGQGIEVTWNAVLPNNTGSVLYLVQRRSYSGRHAHRQHAVLDNNDTFTSPWRQIEQVALQCQSLNDDGLFFLEDINLENRSLSTFHFP